MRNAERRHTRVMHAVISSCRLARNSPGTPGTDGALPGPLFPAFKRRARISLGPPFYLHIVCAPASSAAAYGADLILYPEKKKISVPWEFRQYRNILAPARIILTKEFQNLRPGPLILNCFFFASCLLNLWPLFSPRRDSFRTPDSAYRN